jgi:hypothetical protein
MQCIAKIKLFQDWNRITNDESLWKALIGYKSSVLPIIGMNIYVQQVFYPSLA